MLVVSRQRLSELQIPGAEVHAAKLRDTLHVGPTEPMRGVAWRRCTRTWGGVPVSVTEGYSFQIIPTRHAPSSTALIFFHRCCAVAVVTK